MLSTKFIFIKGRLHCLASEPWRLVMVQIQFSLIKKIKIRRPEHLLYPTPLHPMSSYFCLTLPQPPKSGRHMCITPNLAWMKVTIAKMSKSKNFLKVIIFAGTTLAVCLISNILDTSWIIILTDAPPRILLQYRVWNIVNCFWQILWKISKKVALFFEGIFRVEWIWFFLQETFSHMNIVWLKKYILRMFELNFTREKKHEIAEILFLQRFGSNFVRIIFGIIFDCSTTIFYFLWLYLNYWKIVFFYFIIMPNVFNTKQNHCNVSNSLQVATEQLAQ